MLRPHDWASQGTLVNSLGRWEEVDDDYITGDSLCHWCGGWIGEYGYTDREWTIICKDCFESDLDRSDSDRSLETPFVS